MEEVRINLDTLVELIRDQERLRMIKEYVEEDGNNLIHRTDLYLLLGTKKEAPE